MKQIKQKIALILLYIAAACGATAFVDSLCNDSKGFLIFGLAAPVCLFVALILSQES